MDPPFFFVHRSLVEGCPFFAKAPDRRKVDVLPAHELPRRYSARCARATSVRSHMSREKVIWSSGIKTIRYSSRIQSTISVVRDGYHSARFDTTGDGQQACHKSRGLGMVPARPTAPEPRSIGSETGLAKRCHLRVTREVSGVGIARRPVPLPRSKSGKRGRKGGTRE
jgi:hypothetical protein